MGNWVSSAVTRFFAEVPLRPISKKVGLRNLVIAAVFTVIVGVLAPPEARWEGGGIGLGTVFLGAFIGLSISDMGLSILKHPKQTIAAIFAVSFVILALASIIKAFTMLSA